MAPRENKCTVLLAGPDPPPSKLGPCTTIWVPLIETHTVKRASLILLNIIDQYDTVLFTSPRTPRHLKEDAVTYNIVRKLKEALMDKNIWSIGPRTKESLEKHLGLKSNIPKEYNTIALAYELKSEGVENVLALRRPGTGPELADIITRSATYTELHVYRVEVDERWQLKVAGIQVDYVAVTSRQIADYVAKTSWTSKPAIISIGSLTTKRLKKHGIKPLCTANMYTLEGLALCLESIESEKRVNGSGLEE
ncbi:MAG: uroporphyrinogen-III synthase [Desulfurococcales archaeon]|nr:uroporphyrinogen-III synthase [Desulfurococcales archaeon]